ncbi:hypothetical protein AWW66_09885 [Micromonospora rosaria]|uniref:Uncharacterized protein n=1 Tax=Micromonospora rosaria TaxID=47874 RepID=A0A136PUF9_9ACTN|nr:CU044_5270 family protein [Micromonospora rosaria]KXK62140.1 hypothetical protein AWW66_09885 [Micromonospora rosaria]
MNPTVLRPAAPRRPPRLGRAVAGCTAGAVILTAATACSTPAGPESTRPHHSGAPTPSAVATTPATKASDHPLLRLADRLTATPDDTHPGPYSYLHTWQWARATTVLARTETQRWRHPDGSGLTIDRRAPDRPLLTGLPDPTELTIFDQTTPTRQKHMPGQLPPALPEPIPTDPATLSDRIRATAPPEAGPTVLLTAAVSINRAHYLDHHQRATLLRVLATIPTLRHDPDAADITGRPGTAVSLTAGASTTTLTFDHTTGALLAHQETLTTTPTSLFQYELFTHGRRSHPPP